MSTDHFNKVTARMVMATKGLPSLRTVVTLKCLKRKCYFYHLNENVFSVQLTAMNSYIWKGSKVESFSEMSVFHEGTFAPPRSALPAAGHIAASLLFACGPVTLQPSFAPW